MENENIAPKTAAEMLADLEREERELQARKRAAIEAVERETHAKREACAANLADALQGIMGAIDWTPGVYAVNVDKDGSVTVIAQTARRAVTVAAQAAQSTVAAADAPRGEKGPLYAKLRAEGKTFTEIANQFGVTPSTVADMVHRHNGTGRHAK